MTIRVRFDRVRERASSVREGNPVGSPERVTAPRRSTLLMTSLFDAAVSDPAAPVRRLPALARLLEQADRVDPSFSGHAVHVLLLSVRIARALGLTNDDVRTVALAAALHDVGKVRVGASILAKPGPLDDAEWAAVRAHPADGEQLLADFVRPEVLRVVRSHHERWDAAGYPDRLGGDAIPIGARIVAVADAYAAMIEQRAYRRPRSSRGARAELRRQRGRQFDPVCVDAALQVTARV